MFAKIVFALPVEGPFDYRVPEGLKSSVEVGKRVWVNFGKRRLVGFVVGFARESDCDDVKNIEAVIDEYPLLDDKMLELTKWISQRYLCSWGQAIASALPAGLRHGKTQMETRSAAVEDYDLEDCDEKSPTAHQSRALDEITRAIDKKASEVFLLHGITGSGKTEVYLQAIKKAKGLGRSSIVLVPEIALTPQTAERFKSRFGNENVFVFHSKMLDSQRFLLWHKIRSQKTAIVVGARSAIFSPVKNLGLIVIDEEHENTYKQEDVPRYNTKDVAIERARLQGACVILGSATPSIESYYSAQKKEFKLLKLPERIQQRDLPLVSVVDMRQQKKSKQRPGIFSFALEQEIGNALQKKEQVMLFLNRRGFSTFVHCRKCGHVISCKSCSVTLTFHKQSGKLVCHYCNNKTEPPSICPKCQSSYMGYFGIGTQRIENEVSRLFPEARIARMDTDALSKRDAHQKILSSFKKQQIDILIGTQMIAKGLDFPNVTLVGVVSADVSLNLPDFRSTERTFNLLTQVGGRAGRGQLKGRVIVQTYSPDHYAIESAKNHDYDEFYKKEIENRKCANFPPFTNLVNVTVRAKKQEKAKDAILELKNLVDAAKTDSEVEILGPSPCIVEKMRGQYRWSMLLRSGKIDESVDLLKKGLSKFKKPSGVYVAVDVDPL